MRRVGEGIERLHTKHEGVRAFRFRSRTGEAVVVTNFTSEPIDVEITGHPIKVPAMDTVLMEGLEF